MPQVFISYRREDAAASAGRLFDRLGERFGVENVFRDVDALVPGAEFAKEISARIGGCNALIAVIGKDWLNIKDAEGRRRLDNADDFVKREIVEALSQQKLVIPALVEGARMPTAAELPAELAALAGRNAIEISETRFDYDAECLIAAVQGDGRRTTMNRSGQRTPHVSATGEAIAAGGDVKATAKAGGTAIVATGNVTIGITLEQYEAGLKRRENEIRAELAATSLSDKQRIALLEKEQSDIEAKLRNSEESLAEYETKLAEASLALEKLKGEISPRGLERARETLAQGDTAAAETLFAENLAAGKKQAAESAFQLGELVFGRVDYTAAYRYYTEAARLQPENADYLNMAGSLAHTTGRYSEALPLYHASFAIRKKALGSEHPDVAASLNNLALLYHTQGLYAQAEPLYRDALAIIEKILPPEHPNVATVRENYASLLEKLKRNDEAQRLRARSKATEQQQGAANPG